MDSGRDRRVDVSYLDADDDEEGDATPEEEPFDPEGILGGRGASDPREVVRMLESPEEAMLRALFSGAFPGSPGGDNLERAFLEAIGGQVPGLGGGGTGKFRDRVLERLLVKSMGLGRPGKKPGPFRRLLVRVLDAVAGLSGPGRGRRRARRRKSGRGNEK
ncbi:MAG: hypothetical protein ACTSU5_14335 [Promethearchaeota archaeon]